MIKNRKNIPYKTRVFLSIAVTCEASDPPWAKDAHVFLTACWQTGHDLMCSYIKGQGI